MARYQVPTDDGVYEVETDSENPTEAELLALVESQGSADEEPGLLRRGAAFTARVGAPIVGGILGAPAGPVGAAAGAAAGGAAGEALAEYILGEEADPTEIALSAGLSAIPAGPFARAAARPGLSLLRRVGLTAAEGAAQGALAAEAESVVREGELAPLADVATGAAGGAALGGAAGVLRPRRATLTPEVPLSPQTEAAEATLEAQGSLFRRVPGLGGDVPPKSPVPDARLKKLTDDVDRLFPQLGEVERLSLKSTIAEHGDEIIEASRSVQSHERTEALARELVFDLSKRLPAGTALNAEQERHVIDLVAPLQQRVTRLAGELALNPDDDVLKLKLQRAANQEVNAIFAYKGGATEAGRTLNTVRQQSKALMSGDAKAILAAQKLGIDAETIAKIIAASPDDPISQYRQIRDSFKPDWKDRLKWYYYTNILSGPETHRTNLISNAISTVLRPAATPFAAAADVVRSAATGKEREVFAGEAPIAALQMYRALPESWNKAAFMFRNGFSLSDVDDFEVRPAEMPGGIATNLVGRSMAAADEFFRSIGFNMELHAGAYQRARKKALKEGLDGTALRDRIAELTSQTLDDKPADLMRQAEEFSRRVTFQEKDNLVARGLTAFRDAVPGGAFLVPFIRTPANIFRQGLQFSPAGLVSKGARAGGRAGQQKVGEAVLGSTLLAPVAWLAATDQITGAAPTDPGEREAFYASGKQPHSVRIGDQWVSYTAAGPLVLPFATIAEAASVWRKTGEISEATVGQIVGQVGRSVLDQSYLTSLSAVFQALEDPQRYGQAFVQNLASGLIPLVGLQRGIIRATDPAVREATTFEEGLKRNVVGLSTTLRPKLDALGDEIEPVRPGIIARTSEVKHDPVRDELASLGVELEPLRRSKSLKVDDEDVALDANADHALRRTTGVLRRAFLQEMIADPAYAEMTTEEKAEEVHRVVRQAGDAAKEAARDLVRDGKPITFDALTADVPLPEVQAERAAEQAAEPESAPAVPIGGPKTKFDDLFERVGNAVGIDPSFVKAVAKEESSFNPDARGAPTKYGTAIGMMQILPSTFRLFEAEARRLLGREPLITNPIDNVLVGALYYRSLLDRTGNDPAAAARYYHGGEILANHGPKTRAYGEKVARTYAAYAGG